MTGNNVGLNGLVLIGLPESTVNLLTEISKKTGQDAVDILTFALGEYAQKILTLTGEQAQSNLKSEKQAYSSRTS